MTVFKLPTAKLDFIDFLQIEAAFLKTNYITFSYLPIATDERNISEVSVLLDFYRHWLLKRLLVVSISFAFWFEITSCVCTKTIYIFFNLGEQRQNIYRGSVMYKIKHKLLPHRPIVCVRYINILTSLRGFQDKLPYLVLLSLYSSLF